MGSDGEGLIPELTQEPGFLNFFNDFGPLGLEETPILFILTFVGASIRDIRNFRRWAGCRDHSPFLKIWALSII